MCNYLVIYHVEFDKKRDLVCEIGIHVILKYEDNR